LPLEQAKLVAEYIGGSFTVFDALDLSPEDFNTIYVVASGKGLAEVARIKKATEKAKNRGR